MIKDAIRRTAPIKAPIAPNMPIIKPAANAATATSTAITAVI